MIFHKLRITFLVITGILSVSFRGLVPVGLVHLLRDKGEASFGLSFLSLVSALFFCILGWTLKMEDHTVSLVEAKQQERRRPVSLGRGIWIIARGSVFGILGGSVFLMTCGLVGSFMTELTYGIEAGSGYTIFASALLVGAHPLVL